MVLMPPSIIDSVLMSSHMGITVCFMKFGTLPFDLQLLYLQKFVFFLRLPDQDDLSFSFLCNIPLSTFCGRLW